VRLLVLNSGEMETWKDNSSASHGYKYSPKDIFNVDAYALYCLIKHTHLKEQAAKSWRLLKVLFHVCMSLDGSEFHF
jgi:hypothetical protein